MGKKKASIIVLMLVLITISMLSLTFNIQPAKSGWTGTVYIRADGSIDPPDAPITTYDNITYTLTDNITSSADGIIVERSNIIIDGAGYTLQGLGSGTGFYLYGIRNVTIKSTNIKGFDYGICLSYSSGNSISGNNITANNKYGIYCQWSSGNVIYGNRITNSASGIRLQKSSNNTLRYNVMTNNTYNFGVFGTEFSHFVNDIDVSNTVDGKSIHYLINQHNMLISSEAGYVGLINCTGITAENLNLSKNLEGALLAYTKNSTITQCNITNNMDGIMLFQSVNNSIIMGNNIANNYHGIYLEGSSNNVISGNNITSNGSYGIWLSYSSNNSICGNTFVDDGLVVGYSHENVVENNTVNGKPLVYLEDVANYSVSDAGQVILVNCNGIRAENLNLSSTDIGVQLWETTNSIISGNTIVNNRVGIRLWFSSNNSISGNNIANNDCGIFLHSSSNNNTIYHNNFVDNFQQVYSYNSINVWDNGYPSGGNYWSDYNDTDLSSGPYQNETGGDGIGDSKFQVFFGPPEVWPFDNYPLMAPFNTFDAGIWNGTAYNVDIVSNSTLSNFNIDLPGKTVSFNITGAENQTGFCRITIPNVIVEDFWQGNYTVLFNDEPWPYRNWTDNTNTYIYVKYTYSTHQITIIPEFPTITTLLLMLTVISIIVPVKRKVLRRKFPT